MDKYCYICYSLNIDDESICDSCENYYCEDCSYTFSIHYQYYGSKCYLCSNQGRRSKLTKESKRDEKIKLLLYDNNS